MESEVLCLRWERQERPHGTINGRYVCELVRARGGSRVEVWEACCPWASQVKYAMTA